MKKREIVVVLALILFGLIYHAVEKIDFSFFHDISFSVDETKLLSDRHFSFLQKEMRFPGVRKILLDNPAGEVKIEKAADGDVLLHSTVRVYHDEKSEADTIQGQVKIETRMEKQTLKISVPPSNFPYRRVRLLFALAVPEDVLLEVNNHHGNVDIRGTGREIRLDENYGNAVVENIDSSVRVRCQYGGLHLKNISGKGFVTTRYANLDAENIGGLEIDSRYEHAAIRDIQGVAKIDYAYGSVDLDGAESAEIHAKHTRMVVKNVGKGSQIKNSHESIWLENLSGPIHLSTKYCKINLFNCRSDSLAIDNSFENVDIQNFVGTNVDISLRHGAIRLNFAEVLERINMDCQYGNIVLELPSGLTPSFNIRTKQGEIVNSTGFGFPILQEGTEKYVNFAGQLPEIMIRSVYGNVVVKNR